MNAIITPDMVEKYERAVAALPQIDLQTTHAFCGGMYARTIHLRAGDTLVGATHKTDHISVGVGDILVSTDEGLKRFTGHFVLAAPSGAKRIGLALTTTVWTTICKTDAQDATSAEDELVVEAAQLQTRKLALAQAESQKLEN